MAGYVYRGTGRDELTPESEPRTKSGPRRKRRVAICGTTGGYSRHLRLNEPVDDACFRANADYCRARRAALKARA